MNLGLKKKYIFRGFFFPPFSPLHLLCTDLQRVSFKSVLGLIKTFYIDLGAGCLCFSHLSVQVRAPAPAWLGARDSTQGQHPGIAPRGSTQHPGLTERSLAAVKAALFGARPHVPPRGKLLGNRQKELKNKTSRKKKKKRSQ